MDELRKLDVDAQRHNILHRMNQMIRGNWIFNKWYEKFILFLLMAWAGYSGWRWLFP